MSALNQVALVLGWLWLAIIALVLVYVIAIIADQLSLTVERRVQRAFRRSRAEHYARTDRYAFPPPASPRARKLREKEPER